MRSVAIKAGERKRILRKLQGSMGGIYAFTAIPSVAGETPSGLVEVKGSNWIFPKPVMSQALEVENRVTRGTWDTFYSVYVTPDQDLTVQLENPAISKLTTYLVLSAVIVAIALAAFAMTIR